MTLAALIRKRGAGEIANDNPAKVAKDGLARERPLAGLATLALATPPSPETDHLPDPLLDPAAEARRSRVLAMLAEHREARYAVLTDTKADPDAVLLTMAIRGQASFELRIPPKKYDPWLLLALIERHGGTIH